MASLRRAGALVFASAVSLLMSDAPSAQQQQRGGGGAGPADSFVTTINKANFNEYVPPRGAGVFLNFYMPS